MTTTVNPVLRVAPAAPAEAAAHFRAGLAFHTDVSDVAAALGAGGEPGFVLVDSRSTCRPRSSPSGPGGSSTGRCRS
jgi:hypothetical protein